MNASVTESRELLADFVDEAAESLQDLPAQLDAYCRRPEDDEPINAVFRAVHSIKGCAGFLGVRAIKTFSHSLENTLDEVRTHKVSLGDELRRLFVESFDLHVESNGQVFYRHPSADSELDEPQLNWQLFDGPWLCA